MQLAFPMQQVQGFILILFRVGGIIAFAPVIGTTSIPPIVKVSLAFAAAILFFPGLAGSIPAVPNDVFTLVLAITGELLIGIAIGLIGRTISSAVQFAGEIIGFHMGLRIANVFDPSAEISVSVLGAFYNLVTILLLLSFNFHIILLGIMKQSYVAIAPLGLNLRLEAADVFLRIGSNIFLFALQVVAPLLAVMFFIEVVIAVLAKTARQFNMLMLQFPIKILLGFMVLAVAIRVMPQGVEHILGRVLGEISRLFDLLG
jgi:flagellar biosynthetic protein FliR